MQRGNYRMRTLTLTLTQAQPAEAALPPAQALFEPDGIPPVPTLLNHTLTLTFPNTLTLTP